MKTILHRSLSVLLAMGILASSVPVYASETQPQDTITVQAVQASEQQTADSSAVTDTEIENQQAEAEAGFGTAGSQYAEPKLLSAEFAEEGAKITWKAVSGASDYRVYRKTGEEDWTELEDVADTEYTDDTIQLGTVYQYTVCVLKDGKVGSGRDEEGISFCRLSTPELTSVSNAESGVKVKWESVKNAEGYRVYRKLAGGAWTELKNVTGTGFTDSSVESGKSYAYTVGAMYDEQPQSDYDKSGLKTTYYAAPELTAAKYTASGAKVSWEAVAGAENYRLYRKVPGGSWSTVKNTAGTSFTDTSVKANQIYVYTVRVMGTDKPVSAYDVDGIEYRSLSAPKLTAVSNGGAGVKLAWNAVKNAEGYRVYRKTGSGKWVGLGNIEGTKYTDSSAQSGKSYRYTVRALHNGEVWSGYNSTGLAIQYFARPELTAATNGSVGVKVTWKAVSGAKTYRVYRMNSDGGWNKLRDVEGTSIVDKNVKSGKNYIYTVRVLKNSSVVSAYDADGIRTFFMTVPQLDASRSSSNGIKISWSEVGGAKEYRVYRSTEGGKWQGLTNVTGTSYNDQNVKAGTDYTYTVRAVNGGTLSMYDKDGVDARYLAAPKITLTKGKEGVGLSWNKIAGAQGYYIYRRFGDSGWKKIGKTTQLLYADESGFSKSGTYSYTVRAYYGSSLGYYVNADAPSVAIKVDTAEVNRRLKKVMNTYPDGKKLGSGYSFAGAGQCMGFAREVYYRVFGEVARWDYAGNPKTSEDKGKFTKVAKTSSLKASSVSNVVKQAKPGDVLQLEGPKAHSMIYLSRDDSGFTVYDANWSGPNQVDIRHVSYGSYASRSSNSLSLLHSNEYPGE